MKEKIVALTQEEVLITISAIRDKISDIQEALREVQKKEQRGIRQMLQSQYENQIDKYVDDIDRLLSVKRKLETEE